MSHGLIIAQENFEDGSLGTLYEDGYYNVLDAQEKLKYEGTYDDYKTKEDEHWFTNVYDDDLYGQFVSTHNLHQS